MAERQYDWAAIAKNPKFIELHHKKHLFLFGWWIFSSCFISSSPSAQLTRRVFSRSRLSATSTSAISSLFPSSSFPGESRFTMPMSPTKTSTGSPVNWSMSSSKGGLKMKKLFVGLTLALSLGSLAFAEQAKAPGPRFTRCNSSGRCSGTWLLRQQCRQLPLLLPPLLPSPLMTNQSSRQTRKLPFHLPDHYRRNHVRCCLGSQANQVRC